MGYMYRVLLADDEQIERMALASALRGILAAVDISEAVNGQRPGDIQERKKARSWSWIYPCRR